MDVSKVEVMGSSVAGVYLSPFDVKYLVLHHTASKTESLTWNEIKQYHVNVHGWNDIGYHFGIVADDPVNKQSFAVVQGRPISLRGAHAKGFNHCSIGIAFEGNFEESVMPRAQFDLGVTLLSDLLIHQYSHLMVDLIKGHRDLPYPTLCPGRKFPMHEMIGAVKDNIYHSGVH